MAELYSVRMRAAQMVVPMKKGATIFLGQSGL